MCISLFICSFIHLFIYVYDDDDHDHDDDDDDDDWFDFKVVFFMATLNNQKLV